MEYENLRLTVLIAWWENPRKSGRHANAPIISNALICVDSSCSAGEGIIG